MLGRAVDLGSSSFLLVVGTTVVTRRLPVSPCEFAVVSCHGPNRTRNILTCPQAKHITLATVATHFGVPVITVSRLERGHQRNEALANHYRRWLIAA